MPPRVPTELDSKIAAVERLVALFKWERLTYLIVTCLALTMLLIAAGVLLATGERSVAVLAPLFGSSGLITFSLGRLLRMWDQALHLVSSKAKEKS